MVEKKILFKLLEEFNTIQGEGLLAGRPTYFMRFRSCPMTCSWCDSNFGEPKEGLYDNPFNLSLEEWWEKYPKGIPAPHVCLTGGEPLLYPDEISEWIMSLAVKGQDLYQKEGALPFESITIETGGAPDIRKFRKLVLHKLITVAELGIASMQYCLELYERVSIDLDYKMSSAGAETKALQRMENFSTQLLGENDCVKFVVADHADLEEAFSVIEQLKCNEYTNVFISPCWDNDLLKFQKWSQDMAWRVLRWNDNRFWKKPLGISLQVHKIFGAR